MRLDLAIVMVFKDRLRLVVMVSLYDLLYRPCCHQRTLLHRSNMLLCLLKFSTFFSFLSLLLEKYCEWVVTFFRAFAVVAATI